MILCLCVIVFFATVLSGPAGLEWVERFRARRRLEIDRPVARVVYLPSAACRGPCAEETECYQDDSRVEQSSSSPGS